MSTDLKKQAEQPANRGANACYTAVPVDAAREIAEKYDKSMVIISAYDPAFNRTHSVSFGVKADDKETAANISEQCVKFLLGDTEGDTHQDYRFIPEGERASLVDNLVKACRDMVAITNPLTWPPDERVLARFRRNAEEAIKAV